MKLYEINREERHFEFLFPTALISCPEFRKVMFADLGSRASLLLNPMDFDIYAEVAILRDYWNKLGDHNQYTAELHARRLTQHENPLGITWDQVIDVYNRTRARPDAGADMIARHLKHMPKAIMRGCCLPWTRDWFTSGTRTLNVQRPTLNF